MANKEKIQKYVDAINYMNEQILSRDDSGNKLVSEENKINLTINLLRDLYGDLFNDGVLLSLVPEVKKLLFGYRKKLNLSLDDQSKCMIEVKSDLSTLCTLYEFLSYDEKIMSFGTGLNHKNFYIDKLNDGYQLICKIVKYDSVLHRIITYNENGLIRNVYDRRQDDSYADFSFDSLNESREVDIDENLNAKVNYSYGTGRFGEETKIPEKTIITGGIDDVLRYYSFNDTTFIDIAYLNYFPELKNIIDDSLFKKSDTLTDESVRKTI